MLLALVCDCGSSEPLARKIFRRADLQDWLTRHINRGKTECAKVLRQLPQYPEIIEISEHIDKAGPYVVILGIDEDFVKWVDIKNGDMASMIQAEVIAKKFA